MVSWHFLWNSEPRACSGGTCRLRELGRAEACHRHLQIPAGFHCFVFLACRFPVSMCPPLQLSSACVLKGACAPSPAPRPDTAALLEKSTSYHRYLKRCSALPDGEEKVPSISQAVFEDSLLRLRVIWTPLSKHMRNGSWRAEMTPWPLLSKGGFSYWQVRERPLKTAIRTMGQVCIMKHRLR